MNPEIVYDRHADGVEWSDIQEHLPRLREYARGDVFEIGVRGGISTAALLMGTRDHSGHVTSLDVHDCSALFDGPNWTFVHGHSVIDAERILPLLPKALNVLFVDSDHSYNTTHCELEIYGSLVKKDGGVILMHDTDLPWGGVRKALDEYAQQIGKTPIYHTGSFGLGELRP